MKKYIAFFSLLIVVILLGVCTGKHVGNNLKTTQKSIDKKVLSKSDKIKTISPSGYYDYPFINFYFRTTDDWLIVDEKGYDSHIDGYRLIENGGDVEYIKQQFVVNALPLDSEIQPNGTIYLYKNKQKVLHIPYLDIVYEGKEFSDKFRTVAIEEFKKIVKTE